MKKLSVFSYTLLILLSIAILSIGTISIFSIKTLSDFIYNEVGTSLKEETRLIRNLIDVNSDNSPEPYQEITERIFEDLNIRLTIIALDGSVLADTHENYRIMDNHSTRPEVLDAMNGEVGEYIRYSNTLSRHMLYITLPPGDKNLIVRTAISIDHIRDKFVKTLSDIAVFSVIIFIITVLLSILSANTFTSTILSIKNITTFYAKGDFSRKLSDSGPQEVSQLKKSINTMGDQLKTIIEKESFQKNELQAMLNSMEDAVLLLDNQLIIKEINPASESLLQSRVEICKGHSIKDFLDNDPIIRMIEDSLALKMVQEKTLAVNRGLDQYYQIHSTPLKTSENEYDGILTVFHDVTRVKQLENMRKDFVANVSHELKTPVTLISGFVETLMDGAINDKERVEQFLHVISRHSKRISNIIDDLLILSNIEDKGTDICKEEVILYDILFSAYTSVLTESEKSKISIDVVCDESLTIHVSPTLIEQAVLNLVINAIKYAGEGSHVVIKGKKENNNSVIIEVTDNGVGMEKEQLERIFERFYRINRQQSKNKGGTGLGLSIVKHIALAHKGNVTVETEPGRGTTFRITLPFQKS
ncbi:sensor histidine kinase [Spirochaeta isovalerica]|uniref:histidine kinase n=1 Tax=Spirochaeta isovalerica TaxID=150 RepID=A0A841R6I3_9SPIO|nr:HAMP domain-containing sensor histidine kinase [Spirochaeta isovalerica]MBB6478787.1 two-component system phosphate regulon sensor histidine kinase PhoR [Spirochaeta isovalerica]